MKILIDILQIIISSLIIIYFLRILPLYVYDEDGITLGTFIDISVLFILIKILVESLLRLFSLTIAFITNKLFK